MLRSRTVLSWRPYRLALHAFGQALHDTAGLGVAQTHYGQVLTMHPGRHRSLAGLLPEQVNTTLVADDSPAAMPYQPAANLQTAHH
jgi:hypothetical protein